MTNVSTVIQTIEKEIGAEKVLSNASLLEEWSIDGLSPQAVLFPETIKEISCILRAAHEADMAVIPCGQKTKMALGGIPHRVDLVLSTARYTKVLDYDVSNFTLTAEAGISLQTVQHLVQSNRQVFPVDAPFPTGSLGGIVATNASGPKRLAYGSLRDVVLGIKVVLPSGECLRYGGKVMKNVAGYDLTKLYIGSLGTLGVLGEVTFRLMPAPEVEKTFFLSFSTLEHATGFLARVRDSFLLPFALELLDASVMKYLGLPEIPPPATVGLLASLAGREEAVEREIKDFQTLGQEWEARQQEVWEGQDQQEIWTALAHLPGRIEQDYPEGVRCKISVPAAAVEPVWKQIKTLGQQQKMETLCFGRGGNGILYVTIIGPESDEKFENLMPLIEEITQEVSRQQGFIVVEKAPPFFKKRLSVWGPTRTTIPLMKNLKAKFDPRSILNPGRFVGGI